MNDRSIVLNHIDLFNPWYVVNLQKYDNNMMKHTKKNYNGKGLFLFYLRFEIISILPKAFLMMIVISCHLLWRSCERPFSFFVVYPYLLDVLAPEVFAVFLRSLWPSFLL